MRKLVSFLFMSVDGVVEAPHRYARGDVYPDFAALIGEAIAQQDAVLLGRRTYEEWAGFWPGAGIEPFASFINGTPKFVASTTLRRLDWEHSTLIGHDLLGAIGAMSGTIGVHGSISLTQALLLAGLIDELRLVVCPALAGGGRRLFEHGGPAVQLDLLSARTTPSGLQSLVYAPRR